jgi:hypothetical protein
MLNLLMRAYCSMQEMRATRRRRVEVLNVKVGVFILLLFASLLYCNQYDLCRPGAELDEVHGVRHEWADEVVPEGDLVRARATPDPDLRAQHPALRAGRVRIRRPRPRPARLAYVRERGREDRLLRAAARAHDLLGLGALRGLVRVGESGDPRPSTALMPMGSDV